MAGMNEGEGFNGTCPNCDTEEMNEGEGAMSITLDEAEDMTRERDATMEGDAKVWTCAGCGCMVSIPTAAGGGG